MENEALSCDPLRHLSKTLKIHTLKHIYSFSVNLNLFPCWYASIKHQQHERVSTETPLCHYSLHAKKEARNTTTKPKYRKERRQLPVERATTIMLFNLLSCRICTKKKISEKLKQIREEEKQ